MHEWTVECPEDQILQEDLEQIVASFPETDALRGKTVLVTGASGLIGSQVVRALACFNRQKQTGMTVLALVRSREKAQRIFGSLLERGDVRLCLGDVNQPLCVEPDIDYIIHGASATSSKYFVSNPAETIMTAICGTEHVLNLARDKQVQSMVYLSSLEVYGTPSEDKLTAEADYGYIDPLSVRSSYSESKRMAECLCVAYLHEYQVPVKIARLSQTFGSGVAYEDGRVFAEFARCVLEKRSITLRTEGRTVRSYCYTADAVSALLYLLIRGKSGEAYNVTNMQTAISIRDMAQMVCDLYPDAHSKVVFDIPADVSSFGFNPEMIIKLDSKKLCSLGWSAKTDLPQMYHRLIESWNCRRKSSDAARP